MHEEVGTLLWHRSCHVGASYSKGFCALTDDHLLADGVHKTRGEAAQGAVVVRQLLTYVLDTVLLRKKCAASAQVALAP